MEPQDNELVESTSWWGIPTLFRCEIECDLEQVDIALVGVPHSAGNGTTERDQHFGPRAVRNYSTEYRRAHREFGIVPWDLCRIRDVGDVPLPNAMVNDLAMGDIETFYRKLDAVRARPVSIGGDHSIPLPILRAIAGVNSQISGEPVAIVHLDAHFDADAHNGPYMGSREWAGAFAALIGEEKLADPECVFQIGMRGHGYLSDEREYSRQAGYRVIEKDEFDRLGVERVVAEIRERIGDKPTYITFDLDVLDPTVAPGVANIEPGREGMRMGEAVAILQGMRGMNVIGGDVVCLMPTKDSPNRITTINATVILFEQLSLVADYLHGRREAGER